MIPRAPRGPIAVLTSVAIWGSLAGCGGGSSADSSSSGFIARAEPICRALNAELTKVGAKSTSLTEVARVVPRHVSQERTALLTLERLKPPSAVAGSWRKMLADRRALADQLAKLAEAAQHNEAAAVKALTASKETTHAELARVGRKAGFNDCAQVG
jgi:hypothetical protein